jgi:hypothetical protein
MSDTVRGFIEADVKALTAEHKDLTPFILASLNKTIETCAADNGLSTAEMDFESPSYPYFANCVKNNAFFNTKIN